MTKSTTVKADLLAIEERGGNPLRLTYRELYEFVRAGEPVVTVQDVSYDQTAIGLDETHLLYDVFWDL